ARASAGGAGPVGTRGPEDGHEDPEDRRAEEPGERPRERAVESALDEEQPADRREEHRRPDQPADPPGRTCSDERFPCRCHRGSSVASMSPSSPATQMVESRQPEARQATASDPSYPDNPVLVRLRGGSAVESQPRGAWVLTDSGGRVIEAAGDWARPVFVRSSIKCLQALPLLEIGAADRFDYSDAEVALALASHNAEPCHTDVVAALLRRLGLSVEDL